MLSISLAKSFAKSSRLSDLGFLSEDFEKPLRILSRRHDLIAVSVSDAREQSLRMSTCWNSKMRKLANAC